MVEHPEEVLDQISASQTGLHQWAWLLAKQVDILELGPWGGSCDRDENETDAVAGCLLQWEVGLD